MRSWKSARNEVNSWVQAEVQKPAATPQHALWRSLVLKSQISSTKSICSQSETQNPWNAAIWERRHKVPSRRSKPLNKLDLTAHHQPRFDRAGAVIEYAPDHSTEQMQLLVPPEAAPFERLRLCSGALLGNKQQQQRSTLCAASAVDCPHRTACSYAEAAETFFAANARSLSRVELAVVLLEHIAAWPIQHGPGTNDHGPANSRKSTLVFPFDQLFWFAQVFRKPALDSSFALRNIIKEKKFLFWDDFPPV